MLVKGSMPSAGMQSNLSISSFKIFVLIFIIYCFETIWLEFEFLLILNNISTLRNALLSVEFLIFLMRRLPSIREAIHLTPNRR